MCAVPGFIVLSSLVEGSACIFWKRSLIRGVSLQTIRVRTPLRNMDTVHLQRAGSGCSCAHSALPAHHHIRAASYHSDQQSVIKRERKCTGSHLVNILSFNERLHGCRRALLRLRDAFVLEFKAVQWVKPFAPAIDPVNETLSSPGRE